MLLTTSRVQCFVYQIQITLTGDLLYLMKHHKSIRQAHFDGMFLSADDSDVYRNLWKKKKAT